MKYLSLNNNPTRQCKFKLFNAAVRLRLSFSTLDDNRLSATTFVEFFLILDNNNNEKKCNSTRWIGYWWNMWLYVTMNVYNNRRCCDSGGNNVITIFTSNTLIYIWRGCFKCWVNFLTALWARTYFYWIFIPFSSRLGFGFGLDRQATSIRWALVRRSFESTKLNGNLCICQIFDEDDLVQWIDTNPVYRYKTSIFVFLQVTISVEGHPSRNSVNLLRPNLI